MKQHPLDEQAAEIIQRYRSEEQKLISVLQQIEAQFVFRELGYASMFQYCIERHKLSESRALDLSGFYSQTERVGTSGCDGKS
jgi:hypothetical protein